MRARGRSMTFSPMACPRARASVGGRRAREAHGSSAIATETGCVTPRPGKTIPEPLRGFRRMSEKTGCGEPWRDDDGTHTVLEARRGALHAAHAPGAGEGRRLGAGSCHWEGQGGQPGAGADDA